MTGLHLGLLHIRVSWPGSWTVVPSDDRLLAPFREPTPSPTRTVEVHLEVGGATGSVEAPIESIVTPGWTLDRTSSGWTWTLPDGCGGWFWRLSKGVGGGWQVAVGDALVDSSARRVRDPLCYPLDQIITIDEIIGDGGLLVHAAGFRFPGGALVAPGVSGAGKTTLSRLIHAHSTTVNGLSDDRILVAPRDHEWIAWGTPWAGEGRIAQQHSAPLRHLVFLEHAGDEAIEGLEPQQALDHLLPAASIPWYDPERAALALANAAALVESVPCHRLRFRPVSEAVELLTGLFPQR